MRHRKKAKKLSKYRSRDKSVLRNQAVSLILYEKIITTKAKSRLLRITVEKLITVAKKAVDASDTQKLNAVRKLISYLPKIGAVRKLTEELGPRYKNRSGGYTRIIKIGRRAGDGAETAQIELV